MREIFKNRMVVLTGIGRSGTSLLGKIIGSMKPAFYLFEPALTKFMGEFSYNDTFNRILFEDYYLNIIQGRGNSNSLDDSYWGNYEDPGDHMWRKLKLRRRSDVIDYIQKENPLFILKHTEFQWQFDYAQSFWPGVKYIVIFRHGSDVVSSAVSRGWFTDEWCNDSIVESTFNSPKTNIPNYLFVNDNELKSCKFWQKWNPETRAACVWRSLNEIGIKYKRENPQKVIQFRYEDFCKCPTMYSKALVEWLNLEPTDTTRKHIAEVRSPKVHDFNIEKILEPERTKFINLNKRLGYKFK